MVIRIHNQLSRDWESDLSDLASSNMEKWELSGPLNGASFTELTVEFKAGATSANAYAKFETKRPGPKWKFVINASIQNGERKVSITWLTLLANTPRVNLFPPVFSRRRFTFASTY